MLESNSTLRDLQLDDNHIQSRGISAFLFRVESSPLVAKSLLRNMSFKGNPGFDNCPDMHKHWLNSVPAMWAPVDLFQANLMLELGDSLPSPRLLIQDLMDPLSSSAPAR